MKRLLCILLVFCFLLAICGCSQTSINTNAEVTLTFIYGTKEISVILPNDEAERIIDILDGNTYDPISSGIPACGFNKNVSIKIGNRVYAIACDTCNTIQDLGNLRYFSVSQDDIEYIHALFAQYGGYFPCI